MTGPAANADPPEARVQDVADALYALLPEHVRHVDQTVAGGALHALCGVLALPSAEIDAETDAFYDALFVETAGPAALEAIAALVAATPVRPGPPGSALDQRAYVANTVRYRRGKGTARVVEQLAADVTGLGAVAVEYFQRLARCQHLLDVRPERPGTAHLVDGTTTARAGSAFDVLPRLLDVRPVTRLHRDLPAGRHAVTALGVHLLRPRVTSFPAPRSLDPAHLAGVPQARAWVVGGQALPGHHQLAAQPGAPLRLFTPDRRADAAGGRVQDRDLPERLRRLPLHRETEELRRAEAADRSARLPDRPWFDEQGAPFTVYLRRTGATDFERVPPARVRIANLVDAPLARPPAGPVACAVDPVTGRVVVAEPAPDASDVDEVRVAWASGRGRAIGAGAQDRSDPEVPFEIRDSGASADLVWLVDPTRPAGGVPGRSRVVPTLADALAEVASQGSGRRSLVLLIRCDLEERTGGQPFVVTLHADSEVHLVAAQWWEPRPVPGAPADASLRGFVLRRERRFTVAAPLQVVAGAPGGRAGRLVLDGLELTAGLELAVESAHAVDLRHVTVRHPGHVALGATGALSDVAVTVDSSVCGPIRLGTGGTATGRLDVRDSVLDGDSAPGEALTAPDLDVGLCNVTVLGPSSMRSLEATNVIFTESTTVTRRQSGCVRYSFVPPDSRTPREHRTQPALALEEAREAKGAPLTSDERVATTLSVQPVLMDVAVDEPTHAMLHALCPDAIRSGGEADAEMGAFARAAFGVATANLVSLFDDYLPVALEAGVIDDTRSGAVATRRDVP
ncbi:hypothetical protein PHK61_28750 [Actinomycetospora lutea]|uniref:hypothetical protein n=1 Tax=Actinomycetospora lutea TaxID=663604 RepID=UPI002366E7CD|nr:hypothetical protein [Actinomycetospora lutea]MDD7942411.1 hypothetical protein [Actinomycetospora lutea]